MFEVNNSKFIFSNSANLFTSFSENEYLFSQKQNSNEIKIYFIEYIILFKNFIKLSVTSYKVYINFMNYLTTKYLFPLPVKKYIK